MKNDNWSSQIAEAYAAGLEDGTQGKNPLPENYEFRGAYQQGYDHGNTKRYLAATVRERIEGLRAAFEVKCNAHQEANFPNLAALGPVQISVSYGTRYAKIVRGGSVSAFVDVNNGDIYYPASWKAPAKHVRGSVMAPDFGLSCFGDYAVRTLR